MLSDGERTVGGERAIGGRGEPVLAFRKHLPLPLLAGLRDERDLADDVDEHVERERGLGGAPAAPGRARSPAQRCSSYSSSRSGDAFSPQMFSPPQMPSPASAISRQCHLPHTVCPQPQLLSAPTPLAPPPPSDLPLLLLVRCRVRRHARRRTVGLRPLRTQ